MEKRSGPRLESGKVRHSLNTAAASKGDCWVESFLADQTAGPHSGSNRPERKRLSCFKVKIFVIYKLKLTLVIKTDVRFLFSKGAGVE